MVLNYPAGIMTNQAAEEVAEVYIQTGIAGEILRAPL